MIKRAIIQLGGADPKIRISRPGVDVDSAGEFDFLLHEEYLFAQAYYSEYIPCPFAGNTGQTDIRTVIPVTVPAVTSSPAVILYTTSSEGMHTYPRVWGVGGGNPEFGWQLPLWGVNYEVITSSLVNVEFWKSSASRVSPQGAQLVLMRSGDA